MMGALLMLVLPACLAVSFLCSGMEAGLFTLGRWRIMQQMRAGQARAERLYGYLQDTENFLWTVLIGNTIAFFGAMWIVAIALLRAVQGHSIWFWVTFLAVAFVFYVFCDLLPKTVFRKFPNRLCLILSAPFRLLHIALSPLVSLVEGIAKLLLRWTGGRTYKGQVFSNRNELRLLMEDTPETLTSEERGMMDRVFDLNSIAVRQLTIPFARFPPLSTSDRVEDSVMRFRELPQNVLPVWSADAPQRTIAGFVDVKRLIFAEKLDLNGLLANHLTPRIYLDEDLRLHEALRRMQRSGRRIAVVLGRDGRELGLITLEAILRFIFGEVKL
jgi:CBS domain containing-hemolysin-like protein